MTVAEASASGPTPTEALGGRVRGLRTRVGAGQLDRALLLIGGLLLPLGILLIVLAWLGASHTVLLFEQIPYMISGGLLGLALVFVGGFVYFTYWQTLMVREGRDQARRTEAVLERIEALLSSSTGVAATTARPAASPAGVAQVVLLATPTGTMLHRGTCQVVSGRDDLRRVPAGTPGFQPCRICRPDLP